MVSVQANFLGKWMDFPYDSKNKTELFAFQTDYIFKLKLHLDNLFNKAFLK